MPGWADPRDTLEFRCPICGSMSLRPEPFAEAIDPEGRFARPTERWFACARGEVEYRFRITWEEFRKHG